MQGRCKSIYSLQVVYNYSHLLFVEDVMKICAPHKDLFSSIIPSLIILDISDLINLVSSKEYLLDLTATDLQSVVKEGVVLYIYSSQTTNI